MIKKIIGTMGKFILNITIVLVSLSLSLCAAEWFVRTYMPSPDYGCGKRPALKNKLFMYDEILGWKGSPNSHSRYISKDFKVSVTHDALGYRNQSPPYIPGKKNYLLLGDSYAWGWGVEDTETAAAVFNADNKDSNLYSLGVPGYGTDQELIAFRQLLEQHPEYLYDGVILAFYLNDFADIVMDAGSKQYPKPVFRLDSTGALTLTNVPVPHKILEEVSITEDAIQENWLNRIQLVNLILPSLFRFIGFVMAPPPPEEIPEPINFSDWENNSLVLAPVLLTEIQKLCHQQNTDLHVVFLITQNTDAHPATLIAALANKLNTLGIPHSFFYSKKFPRTDLWLDTHYTPYGQALLADHIAKVIANKKVTDKKPASSQ